MEYLLENGANVNIHDDGELYSLSSVVSITSGHACARKLKTKYSTQYLLLLILHVFSLALNSTES